MDVLLHLALGIGLSTAAGFRILVPFLVAGVAAQQGYLALSPSMTWMGTTPAILALAAATALEVLIYFVPVVGNLMDAVELPAAAIAGTVLTAAVTGGDMHPFLQWSLALIAGGGVASSTQAFTGLARLASTAAGGPAGNYRGFNDRAGQLGYPFGTGDRGTDSGAADSGRAAVSCLSSSGLEANYESRRLISGLLKAKD
jgi:hypothetical protein